MSVKALILTALILCMPVTAIGAEKADFVSGFAKGVGPDNNPLAFLSPGVKNICFTKDGEGITDKAVLVAKGDFQAFGSVVDAVPSIASPLVYNDISALNPEEGTVEVWVKPGFSQVDKLASGAYVYYVFDVWSFTRKDRDSNEEAKKLFPGGMQLLIYVSSVGDKILQAACLQSDGTKVSLVSKPVEMEPHKWYHLAMVWSKDTLSIYLDGKKVASKGISGPIKSLTSPMMFGASQSYTAYLHGLLDNIKIYRSAVYDKDFVPQK